MPRLDLCPAGLCRQGRALLPEKGHQAAAPQGRLHVGRGAVATNATLIVIASVAKQSTLSALPDGLLRFVRNDGPFMIRRTPAPPFSTPASASAGAAAARRWRV